MKSCKKLSKIVSHAIYFVFTGVESILFILEIKQESINVYWCGGMIVIVINMESQGSLFNPCFPLAQLMSRDTRWNKLEMKLFLIRINIFKSIFRCNIYLNNAQAHFPAGQLHNKGIQQITYSMKKNYVIYHQNRLSELEHSGCFSSCNSDNWLKHKSYDYPWRIYIHL